ncbi:MAG: acetyltransferase [Mogibacterium sp.]|nr:acetyltransferase [Mogibacterium sp.]
MKKIIILCAGDFGKEVVWLLEDINKKNPSYEIVGFLDDDEAKKGIIFKGYECLGTTEQLKTLAEKDDVCAVVATQDGSIRKKIVEKHSEFTNWETLIHPSVTISDTSSVGKGSIVCANTNISISTNIGNHCILNLGTTIGHDCEISDYVSFMSGSVISGHVRIGEGAYFGSNSTVVPGRKIGANSVVGAGSVVIRNVRDNISVMGVPAKMIKF